MFLISLKRRSESYLKGQTVFLYVRYKYSFSKDRMSTFNYHNSESFSGLKMRKRLLNGAAMAFINGKLPNVLHAVYVG